MLLGDPCTDLTITQPKIYLRVNYEKYNIKLRNDVSESDHVFSRSLMLNASITGFCAADHRDGSHGSVECTCRTCCQGFLEGNAA